MFCSSPSGHFRTFISERPKCCYCVVDGRDGSDTCFEAQFALQAMIFT